MRVINLVNERKKHPDMQGACQSAKRQGRVEKNCPTFCLRHCLTSGLGGRTNHPIRRFSLLETPVLRGAKNDNRSRMGESPEFKSSSASHSHSWQHSFGREPRPPPWDRLPACQAPAGCGRDQPPTKKAPIRGSGLFKCGRPAQKRQGLFSSPAGAAASAAPTTASSGSPSVASNTNCCWSPTSFVFTVIVRLPWKEPRSSSSDNGSST